MLILGQKLPISLILRTIKFFLKKSYFYPFSKACNQIKFQKKKAFVTFLCLLNLHFGKKKKVMTLSKEKGLADIRMYGQTDGRTDGAEFIGPSG